MVGSGSPLAQTTNAKCINTGSDQVGQNPPTGTLNYTPGNNANITCKPINLGETVASAGVISATNTTDGNGVRVTVAAGTVYTVLAQQLALAAEQPLITRGL